MPECTYSAKDLRGAVVAPCCFTVCYIAGIGFDLNLRGFPTDVHVLPIAGVFIRTSKLWIILALLWKKRTDQAAKNDHQRHDHCPHGLEERPHTIAPQMQRIVKPEAGSDHVARCTSVSHLWSDPTPTVSVQSTI